MSNQLATNGACLAETGDNWSAYSLQGAGRERNSDAFAVFDKDGWQAFAVGDGVGSMPGSPNASRAAVDAVVESLRSGPLVQVDDLQQVMPSVDRSVVQALASSEGPGATTLAFVVVVRGLARLLSVGDSEIHAIPAEGESVLLHPVDHVPAQPNILLAWLDGETSYEAHTHALELENARLCLMTDGIPGALSNDRIAAVVRGSAVRDAAREVVLAARDAGARDDLTAIVVSASADR